MTLPGPHRKFNISNLFALPWAHGAIGPWMEDEGPMGSGPMGSAPGPCPWASGPFMGVLLFPCGPIIPFYS